MNGKKFLDVGVVNSVMYCGRVITGVQLTGTTSGFGDVSFWFDAETSKWTVSKNKYCPPAGTKAANLDLFHIIGTGKGAQIVPVVNAGSKYTLRAADPD